MSKDTKEIVELLKSLTGGEGVKVLSVVVIADKDIEKELVKSLKTKVKKEVTN